ncbi:hypothetical protein EPIR_3650 [Erwinia piriflorinigrans CFBP 5888]|uniref:Uncharacterized protein n=1 Tax=Erwinia piriflorinigrans CFBP 5888 TaxID=1161919 RepID=V5ZCD0_9GAMM|nr:hypothetical protein EPIR_3650 [Erwinia piriflorinigrans CFBP 5888]
MNSSESEQKNTVCFFLEKTAFVFNYPPGLARLTEEKAFHILPVFNQNRSIKREDEAEIYTLVYK